MNRIALAAFFTVCFSSLVFAEMTFNDLPSYCRAMSEASTTTLLARTEGIPRARAEDMMNGMTDPVAIKMVKEVIEFAYSRPSNEGLDAMRADLRKLCLAKKIFAQ